MNDYVSRKVKEQVDDVDSKRLWQLFSYFGSFLKKRIMITLAANPSQEYIEKF